MPSRFAGVLFAATVALQISTLAIAHHSAAMFDLQKQLTVSGTVRVFQFTNPHCFIQLLVPNGSGAVEWNIEMASPAHLIRSGWNRNTIKPGDKLTILLNPARAGGNDGLFLSATRDGTPLGANP